MNDIKNANLQKLVPDYSPEERGQHANIVQRLTLFANWLTEQGNLWCFPDLDAFATYLKTERGLKAHSVKVYLTPARKRYAEMLQQIDLFDTLREAIQTFYPYSIVLMEVAKATNAIKKAATFQLKGKAKRPKASHIYLSAEQVENILNQPTTQHLSGLRDTALLSILYCTGIRDVEVVSLKVEDLRHYKKGELALHVPDCSQCTERLIVYGGLDWCLDVVDSWLREAGITEGYVFRGLRRGGNIRDTQMSVRSISDVLNQYTVEIDGQPYVPQLLDVRHTYARNLYLAGVPFEVIHANLGHRTKAATLNFIGDLNQGGETVPPRLYQPPFSV